MDTKKSREEIQERFIQLGKQVSSELLAERNDILAVYIYGSVGRGEATPHSDLDLHVVLDSETAPDHEDKEIEGVTAGISYHSRLMYTRQQIFADSPEGLKRASGAEGLWELADAIAIYDPGGLIPKTQAKAEVICKNPEVIKMRAGRSLNRAREVQAKARLALDHGRLSSAYAYLYYLTGGDGNPGIIPLLAKSIVQRSGLSLTTRRYIYRAYQACEKLSQINLYKELLGLLGVEEDNSAYVDHVRKCLLSAYDCARIISESAITSNKNPPSDFPVFNTGIRSWLADNFDEICLYANADAAIGMAVGLSPKIIVDNNHLEQSWLKIIAESDVKCLLQATVAIAGIEGDIRSVLAERLKRANDLLETLDN